MPLNTTENKVYTALPEFLKRAIEEQIKIATEEELENATKRINSRKAQIVTAAVLHVQKMMDIYTSADKLIITVKLE